MKQGRPRGSKCQPPGCVPGLLCLECPANKNDCTYNGKQTKEKSELLERCGINHKARMDHLKAKQMERWNDLSIELF